MVSLLRSLNNDLPNGNILILIFSIYSLVNKKVLLCKWVLESETQNISVLGKPPYIFWFSNILISFWLCLFVIKLYSRNDIFKHTIILFSDLKDGLLKSPLVKVKSCQNQISLKNC